MSTIYTLNSKVLKNTVNDKWLIKKAAPPIEEVQIGNQIWKNKNLAIDDGQGGIYTRTVNYGQGNVVEYYYTWDAAVRIASSISGWRLPSRFDWNDLAVAVGGASTAGTKLKSTYGWSSGNGNDSYGFAVFPAGYFSGSSFLDFGSYALFWSSSEYQSTRAYHYLFKTSAEMSSSRSYKTSYYSVRLIKD